MYANLLARLIDGDLPAGSPLNIDALSRELQVSPTPIREALARLEATGLVTRAALRGYQVSPLFSPRELSDLMDARGAIEPVLAGLACARSTPALLGELDAAIADLSAAASERAPGELHTYWEADHRFHVLIAQHADNRFLESAYEALGGHVQRFRLFSELGLTDIEYAVAEHTRILDAFRRGSVEEARERMAEHIAQVKSRALHDREAIAD